jgi:hypothetical protein
MRQHGRWWLLKPLLHTHPVQVIHVHSLVSKNCDTHQRLVQPYDEGGLVVARAECAPRRRAPEIVAARARVCRVSARRRRCPHRRRALGRRARSRAASAGIGVSLRCARAATPLADGLAPELGHGWGGAAGACAARAAATSGRSARHAACSCSQPASPASSCTSGSARSPCGPGASCTHDCAA